MFLLLLLFLIIKKNLNIIKITVNSYINIIKYSIL